MAILTYPDISGKIQMAISNYPDFGLEIEMASPIDLALSCKTKP